MNRGGLTFEIAGPSLLTEALRFRDAVYARDRGFVPSDQMEGEAQHLVAIAFQGVVGYMRLLGPDVRPFDLEASVDLRCLLGSTARPALVGRLCVHPAYRRIDRSLPIRSGLMDITLNCAAENRITHLLLYTYDDLLVFYRAARFVDTKIIFEHKEWGPVRLMVRQLPGTDTGIPREP